MAISSNSTVMMETVNTATSSVWKEIGVSALLVYLKVRLDWLKQSCYIILPNYFWPFFDVKPITPIIVRLLKSEVTEMTDGASGHFSRKWPEGRDWKGNKDGNGCQYILLFSISYHIRPLMHFPAAEVALSPCMVMSNKPACRDMSSFLIKSYSTKYFM